MSQQVDFIVQSPDYVVQLAAEAKALQHLSAEDAAELRQRLLENKVSPPANYFLIMAPQWFYLWKDGRTAAELPPDYVVDAQPLLKSRVGDIPLERLFGASFDLIAFSWLDDVVHSPSRDEAVSRAGAWIVESGLYDAIHDGIIKTNLNA